MVKWAGLENRSIRKGYREFESRPLRQLEKAKFGSPADPPAGGLIFLSLFCEAKRQKRAFHLLFRLNIFLNSKKPIINATVKAININWTKLIAARLNRLLKSGK